MRIILFTSMLIISSFANAVEPGDRVKEIVRECESSNYLSALCENGFYGKNRGFFSVPFMKGSLDEQEKLYKEKLASYPSTLGMHVHVGLNSKADFKVNFRPTDEFYKNSNYVPKKEMWLLPDEKIEGAVFMALINENNKWKIAIPNGAEKIFRKSRMAQWYILMKARRNILRYHMVEAEKYNLSRSELINKVSYATAPIVLLLQPESENEIKKWIKLDIKDVVSFYDSLDNEEDILKALEKEHDKKN